GPYTKIFDIADFGYRRVVIERPLRLNFQTTPERIRRVHEQTAFANLATSKKKGKQGEKEAEEGRKRQEEIIKLISTMDSERLYKNRDEFTDALLGAGIKVPSTVKNAIVTALAERDPTADICTDAEGNP